MFLTLTFCICTKHMKRNCISIFSDPNLLSGMSHSHRFSYCKKLNSWRLEVAVHWSLSLIRQRYLCNSDFQRAIKMESHLKLVLKSFMYFYRLVRWSFYVFLQIGELKFLCIFTDWWGEVFMYFYRLVRWSCIFYRLVRWRRGVSRLFGRGIKFMPPLKPPLSINLRRRKRKPTNMSGRVLHIVLITDLKIKIEYKIKNLEMGIIFWTGK